MITEDGVAVFGIPSADPSGALYGPWTGFGVLGDKLKGESQNETENRSIQRDHAGKRAYN